MILAAMMIVLEHQMLQTLLEHVHANKQQENRIEQSKQGLEALDSTKRGFRIIKKKEGRLDDEGKHCNW